MPSGIEDPDELCLRVARRITELRDAAGMTQREVADAVGFDTSSYARMESGKENLTLRTMASIAVALKVPTITLLEQPTSPAKTRTRGRPPKSMAKRATSSRS